MPIEPRHPLAQAVVPQAANPGVCHLTQARRRPLSFWKPSQKDSPNTLQGNRAKDRQKTLRNPFLQPAALSRHTSPPPDTGSPHTETPPAAALTRFPARHSRKSFGPLPLRPSTTNRVSRGGGQPVREGAGRRPKEPSASAQTRTGGSAPFFWAKVGGACRLDNRGAFFHTPLLRLSRLLRSCFQQHGEQRKWGTQANGRALILLHQY